MSRRVFSCHCQPCVSAFAMVGHICAASEEGRGSFDVVGVM